MLKKILNYINDTWIIHAIAWMPPIISWDVLHDFPPSSVGGYWHSFWITWVIAIAISVFITVVWYNISEDLKL